MSGWEEFDRRRHSFYGFVAKCILAWFAILLVFHFWEWILGAVVAVVVLIAGADALSRHRNRDEESQ